jgi:hypothetical protein
MASPHARHFKLWIEVEEFDPDTGDYIDLCKNGTFEPVPIGNTVTLQEARDVACLLDLALRGEYRGSRRELSLVFGNASIKVLSAEEERNAQ